MFSREVVCIEILECIVNFIDTLVINTYRLLDSKYYDMLLSYYFEDTHFEERCVKVLVSLPYCLVSKNATHEQGKSLKLERVGLIFLWVFLCGYVLSIQSL